MKLLPYLLKSTDRFIDNMFYSRNLKKIQTQLQLKKFAWRHSVLLLLLQGGSRGLPI
jgi:hypothetical protein